MRLNRYSGCPLSKPLGTDETPAEWANFLAGQHPASALHYTHALTSFDDECQCTCL